MKINEVIAEGKLRPAAHDATPDLQTWPALNNNNSPYAAYRFGMALAGSPDYGMDKDGPIGGDFTTIGYSDADKAILDGAAKIMGVKSIQQTSNGSKEIDIVNKTSPTRKVGAIQRKSK
jgi:hypothetical protein